MAPNKPLEDDERTLAETAITYHKHETYSAWDKCTQLLAKRENEQVEAWKNEVENLLNFAGTFLTVNTLFIDASSSALQPDDARTTVDVLYTISRQLNGTHTVASPQPFERKLLDIIQCSFIFASLLLSLIAAGLGLWVKEWLREYLLDLPNCPRELVHVRQFRHRGIHEWHMRQHVSMISFLLNLAIALFSVGLMLFARKIDLTLYSVLIGLLGLWAVLTWGTAFLPAVSASCPYRSPFSRGLYVVVHRVKSAFKWCGLPKKEYESMVDCERTRAKEKGGELEVEALQYVNREYWGHEDLSAVNQCFKDINSDDAKQAIQTIIVERLTKDHKMFVRIRDHPDQAGELLKPPSDGDTLQLLRMWGNFHMANEPDNIAQCDAEKDLHEGAPNSAGDKLPSDEELLQVLRMWCTRQSQTSALRDMAADNAGPTVVSDEKLWARFRDTIGLKKPTLGCDWDNADVGCWSRRKSSTQSRGDRAV